jgi:hypothetical protein
MAGQGVRTFIVAAVAAASVAWCNTAAGAIQLQLRLDKGKTCYHKTVIDQRITQTVMGQSQAFDQGIGIGWKLQVLDADARGNMRIQYTYLWSRFKSTNPMAPFDYDSSRPTSVPAGAEGFAALLNRGFIIELSPKGRVLKMEGMKEFRDAVLKKLSPGMDMGPALQVLNAFIEEQAIREMIEGSLGVFPDEPVEPGNSWTQKTTITTGFPMDAEFKRTLAKVEAGVATVAESCSLRSNPGGPPMDVGGMKMKFEGTGTQEGTMLIEETTGLITSSKAHQQIKGEIKLGASAEGPFDMMAIPVVFDTSITFEMSDKPLKAPPNRAGLDATVASPAMPGCFAVLSMTRTGIDPS